MRIILAIIVLLISLLFLKYSLKISELIIDDIGDMLEIEKVIIMTIVMLIFFLLQIPVLFVIYS